MEKLYTAPKLVDIDGSVWCKFLSDIRFVRETGWAVGSGQILRTFDGGRSWINQIEKVNLGKIMTNRVFAVDSETAWLIMVAHRPLHNCYYTRNGGEEWWEKRLPNLLQPDDVFFLDSATGWIVSNNGEIPSGEAMIHLTNDGGRTWESHELEMSGAATRVKFLTPNSGLLIQHTSGRNRTRTICNLLSTSDHGHSWRVMSSFDRLIRDFLVIDEKNFIVVGKAGLMRKTSDGGVTWKRIASKTRHSFTTIDSNGCGRILAGGDFGLMLMSNDHGTHWTKYELQTDDHVVGVSFVAPEHAVVATSSTILSLSF